MKRILILLSLVIPVMMSAGPVSRDAARKCADAFFSSGPAVRSTVSQARLVWTGEPEGSATEPAFYVYARPSGGFVIVSGDDAHGPVLAWSEDSEFVAEDMPDNVKWWLDELRTGILSDRAAGVMPDSRTQEAWAALQSSGTMDRDTGALLLETALWNQYSPFNDRCPVVNGSRTPTGCVATAMAIIMRYHKWPVAGQGTFASYSYTSGGTTVTVPGYSLGRAYDWTNMPVDMSNYMEPQADEVSRLMLDCGMSLSMKYEVAGSSASTTQMISALVNYFDYDSAAKYLNRASYSSGVWSEMLKANLRQYGPLSYRGSASSGSGGHSYVVSGYDTSDRFYVNFGWSGLYNGYYALPSIRTYNADQAAIFFISPAGRVEKKASLCIYDVGVSTTTTIAKIATTKRFDASTGTIFNMGSASFAGQLAFFRVDKDGNMGERLCTPFSVSIGSLYSSASVSVICTLQSSPNLGDVARLYYCADGTEDWIPVPTSSDGLSNEIAIADTPDKTIERVTTLSYAIETGILTIKTKGYVKYVLTGEDGTNVVSGTSPASGRVVLETLKYPAGTYTMSFTRGSESHSLVINLRNEL